MKNKIVVTYLEIISYSLFYKNELSMFEIFVINNFLNETGKYIVPDNNFNEIYACIDEWNDFFQLSKDNMISFKPRCKENALELFPHFIPNESKEDISKSVKKIKRLKNDRNKRY